MTETQIIAQLLQKIELLEKQVSVMSRHILVLEENCSVTSILKTAATVPFLLPKTCFELNGQQVYGKRAERNRAVSRVTTAQR